MDSTYHLLPEQRTAAETLLGRPLRDYDSFVVTVTPGSSEIVVRLCRGIELQEQSKLGGKWNIPICFGVLSDASLEEIADFDARLSEPVQLTPNE